jgi:hypothetical protein
MPKSSKINESYLLEACKAAQAQKKNQISPRLRVNMAFLTVLYVTASRSMYILEQPTNQSIEPLRDTRRRP